MTIDSDQTFALTKKTVLDEYKFYTFIIFDDPSVNENYTKIIVAYRNDMSFYISPSYIEYYDKARNIVLINDELNNDIYYHYCNLVDFSVLQEYCRNYKKDTCDNYFKDIENISYLTIYSYISYCIFSIHEEEIKKANKLTHVEQTSECSADNNNECSADEEETEYNEESIADENEENSMNCLIDDNNEEEEEEYTQDTTDLLNYHRKQLSDVIKTVLKKYKNKTNQKDTQDNDYKELEQSLKDAEKQSTESSDNNEENNIDNIIDQIFEKHTPETYLD